MARLVEVQGSAEGKVKRQTMHERSRLILLASRRAPCLRVRNLHAGTYVVATSHLVLRKRIHEMKLLQQRFRLTIFVCLTFIASNARTSGPWHSLSRYIFQLEVGSPPPPQLLPRQLVGMPRRASLSNRKLRMDYIVKLKVAPKDCSSISYHVHDSRGCRRQFRSRPTLSNQLGTYIRYLLGSSSCLLM